METIFVGKVIQTEKQNHSNTAESTNTSRHFLTVCSETMSPKMRATSRTEGNNTGGTSNVLRNK